MFPAGLSPGALVAYANRAGRVVGVALQDTAGPCLAIEHTAPPSGLVFVPLRRTAGTVTPISEAEARELDKHVHALTFGEVKMRLRRGKLSPEQRRILAAAGAKGMASRWKAGTLT
ncbi:MAG: hypothetical protein BroJett013_19630 [Alphaproteobacteria bacterium]|nr:MAG: hypothetical protein BroJett013_19630 [Alphaproteobacteria bacterium]